MLTAGFRPVMRVAPLHVAIDALERGIARRVAAGRRAPRAPRRCCRCGWPSSRSSTARSSATCARRSRSPAREDAPLTTPAGMSATPADRRPGTRGARSASCPWAIAADRRARRRAGRPPNLFLTLGRHRGAVPRLAALRGPADAGRQAAAARDRARDPPRRPPARLPLRVRAPRAARPPRGPERRRDRARDRTGRRPRAGRRASRRVLQATDELLANGDLADETWSRLRGQLDTRELIELCCSSATTRCWRRRSTRSGSSRRLSRNEEVPRLGLEPRTLGLRVPCSTN